MNIVTDSGNREIDTFMTLLSSTITNWRAAQKHDRQPETGGLALGRRRGRRHSAHADQRTMPECPTQACDHDEAARERTSPHTGGHGGRSDGCGRGSGACPARREEDRATTDPEPRGDAPA